jgi:hypothetical protein
MKNALPKVAWKIKAALMLTAIVLTVLGSGLMFAPHWMGILYGTPESLSGTNGARTAGAAIIALGSLAWAGTLQETRVLRATVFPVLFVWFVLKSVVAYLAMATGVFDALVGRAVLAFDLLLAILFGYFLFVSWVVPARHE